MAGKKSSRVRLGKSDESDASSAPSALPVSKVVTLGILVLAVGLAAMCMPDSQHSTDGSLANSGTQREDTGKGMTLDASEEDITSSTFELDDPVAWMDKCVEACSHGADPEDQRTLDQAKSMGLRDKDEDDPVEICLIRCRMGRKKPDEVAFVSSEDSGFNTPSKVFREYLHCATACSQMKLHALSTTDGQDQALSKLVECGVTHVKEVFPPNLVRELADAVNRLRRGELGFEIADLLDVGALRAGRQQIWLPFVPPFNSAELLRAGPLAKLIKGYFQHRGADDQVVLQSATVIVSRGGVTEDQVLHTDVRHPRTHLEVHLPLQDVSVEMGPTRLCPCTQGSDKGDAEAVLKQKRLLQVKLHVGNKNPEDNFCEMFPSTHYDAATTLGDVTLYDGGVFHKGTANRSGKDRPVLVLAFAASEAEAASRNYVGHLAGKLPVAAAEAPKFSAAYSA